MDPSTFNNPELQQLLQQEKLRAVMNEMIGKLMSRCWDKCIAGTPGYGFNSRESARLTHCAQRYMDMAMLVMRVSSSEAHTQFSF